MSYRVPIGEVATINPRLPSDVEESQEVSFLSMSAVSEDGRVLGEETRVLSETKKGFTYFERGDVLLAKITPCFENGKAAFLGGLSRPIGFGSTEFHVIRPNPEKLDAKYLYYMVANPRFRFYGEHSMKGAAGQRRVPAEFVADYRIPLPPLTEQKRIAAILDKADTIRRKRQQAIQLADQFLRAVFLDMFGDPVTNPKGWDAVSLASIASIRSGVTKGKRIDPAQAVTVPYLRVANVQDGYLDLSEVQDIDVSRADAEKCRLASGDLLLTEGGDPDKLGRGYVWEGQIEGCIHQNHIFSVRVHDETVVNPIYLSALIGSQRGKRYFLKVGKQTTGIATINKTVLSEFSVLMPPNDLQVRYAEIASRVRTLKSQGERSEMNLKSALSQRAFAGDL